MEDELGRKIKRKFDGLTPKNYSYLIDDDSEDKKAKGTKKCVIRRELQFENYKSCLKATQLENKINHLEKKQKKKTERENIKENHKEFIKNFYGFLQFLKIFIV